MSDSLAELGRQDWQQLVERTGAPAFYSWNFLRSIEVMPLTVGSRPYYLTLRDPDGELAAATVVYGQRAVNPFGAAGSAPEPMLVGHLWHCYDSRLLSVAPLTGGTVTAFADALDRLADELGMHSRGLHNLDRTGELASIVTGSLADGATRYRLLPGESDDLDSHLETVGRSSRRTMRKYCRRATEAGLRISFGRPAESLDEDVLALCLATADKHAPGYYPPAALGQLLESLGEDCRILRLELDGELLACSICLLDASSAHFWAGGSLYPPELNWSPQYVLFAAELEHGFRSGKPVLEFGRRNDEFKLRFGLQPHRLASWVWGP
ncbi:MAG: GNAT family N-acetyltransferase [Actinomycetota bacterium]|nr:GNAT family N-acetyltransferase [Actinomycetota bacterium]MDQ2958880.1 GNAT family N-acetyltransferase [Actinomycetota bacterium]